MLLAPDEAELFFKLHRSLMFFVNERLGVVPARRRRRMVTRRRLETKRAGAAGDRPGSKVVGVEQKKPAPEGTGFSQRISNP